MQKKLEFSALLLLVMGLLAACASEPAKVADSTNPLPTSGSTASMSPLPTNTVSAKVSPLPTSNLPAKLSPLPTSGAAASALPTVVAATPAGDQTCVTGYAEGGGDTTPKDLRDAPRQFAFDVKTDAGQMVHVTYTAYPPSSKLGSAVRLVFHAGTVQVGDYMKACGTMDAATSTLRVATQGDSIETYSTKP